MPRWVCNPDFLGDAKWLFPEMATRIGDFIAANPEETDGEYELRGMMIALLANNPRVRLYVGFDDAEEIGAWGWASHEHSGRKSWIWSHYGESTIPEYAGLYFTLLEGWGREVGATHLLHGTYRDPRGFQRKYGFDTVRSIVSRPIPSEVTT